MLGPFIGMNGRSESTVLVVVVGVFQETFGMLKSPPIILQLVGCSEACRKVLIKLFKAAVLAFGGL